MLKQMCLAASAGLCLIAGAVHADAAKPTLAVGDDFPVMTLNDQHDETLRIPDSASLVMFTTSKDADGWFDELLEDEHPAAIEALNAGDWIYISDISNMPALVTRMFALPSLRGRDYPVALVREEADAEHLPAQSGCISVMNLEDNTIKALQYWCSPEEAHGGLANRLK